ncbi:MAG TPA: preprotein translocase subunit SecA [Bacillota bacterium]|nr:preprotein translocase subunit SecA [Bacillota bacterium]
MLSQIRSFVLNANERYLNKTKKILSIINDHYLLFSNKDDSDLYLIGQQLKEEIRQTKNDTKIRCQAFALVKEAVRRVLGVVMHDVQLLGGWVLSDGKVAEMATGEGKTITSILPIFWYALRGEGVHVITVNEYLARRDYEEMGKVFQFLGLTVGLNLAGMNELEKKQAYQKDITYGISTEFGFDFLRDHLVEYPHKRVQRPLSYGIIDEIDSVLIDEARTPLIIAGKIKAAPDQYYVCSRFIKSLKEGRDYELDWETKQVMFTEFGIQKIESTFMIDNLYDLENTTIYHYLLQSLRAEVIMKKDIDYILSEGQVKIIDAFTGRILDGRQFSDGLHQAIEAKEALALSEENRTVATITIQKFFSLYKCISGMSGTVQTEEKELRDIYGLEIISIPTHRPVIRQDFKDLIFLSREEKYKRMIDEIERIHRLGRPVLVGTTSVQQSELIAQKLDLLKLPYQLLNAKKEKEEAEIIAKAGQKGAITIATNMAGRGTDIRLGDGVEDLGGLHVIGSERHESRRIDNQLKGRAGRQGDPGSTQFFLSLEDELILQNAGEEAQALKSNWKGNRFNYKEALNFFEQVQKDIEQRMFEIRSLVCKLDTVIHEQRLTLYQHRSKVIDAEEVNELILDHLYSFIERMTNRYCPDTLVVEEWDFTSLEKKLFFPIPNHFKKVSDRKELVKQLCNVWNSRWHAYLDIQSDEGTQTRLKQNYLQIIDQCWLSHLEVLDSIKQGIHYQAYANQDIIQAYRLESWKQYRVMEDKIQALLYREIIQEINRILEQSLVRIG